MKCISRSITLLVSLWTLAPAADTCALVDGARIHAADLAEMVPAFGALPADKDLGPAPAGTMVRVFYKAQLGALLPGVSAELPDRLCVQRKRDVIPAAVWQTAVETAMTKTCPTTPWKVEIEEVPQHRFPTGEIVFARPGVVASRGSVQLWRGSLVLPDKSSIPIWVRVKIQTQRHAILLQRPVTAGAVLTAEDYKIEEIWAPGLCIEEKENPAPEGLIAKKTMPTGAELLREDIRRPPAVHRGQSIEVESGSGAARIKIPAVAERDGEIGEPVPVRSTWNGSRLMGRVTGQRKVRVE
jgi:flagella basal body P-ring formation protein FlgA